MNQSHYEYIRVTVDEGDLSIRFKLFGCGPSSYKHDEDVTGWSNNDLTKLVKNALDVEPDDPINIQWY